MTERDEPESACIHYRSGYRYQTTKRLVFYVPIYPARTIITDWLTLTPAGKLVIRKGYAWDGASGPTFDSKSSMRASLAHDSLYQMIRLGLIGQEHRKTADEYFHKLCRDDGMFAPRAWLWFHAVRAFAKPATDPSSEAQEECAPSDCDECAKPAPVNYEHPAP